MFGMVWIHVFSNFVGTGNCPRFCLALAVLTVPDSVQAMSYDFPGWLQCLILYCPCERPPDLYVTSIWRLNRQVGALISLRWSQINKIYTENQCL